MLATLLSAGAALATPIQWTLTGVQFTDGKAASGSFFYDASTNIYSNVNINTSTPHTYPFAAPDGSSFRETFDTTAGNATGAPGLDFLFQSALTDAGGTVLLSTNTTSVEGTCLTSTCNVIRDARFVTAGSIVAAPAPAFVPTASDPSLLLLALGLVGAGLVVVRRSTRSIA